MMDQKTMLNRDAKGTIQIMLADIGDDKKKELAEKYSGSDKTISDHAQKALIGNWLNNATRMLLKGATKDELDKVIEHIQVLIMARKYQLDIKRSYDDHDLLHLSEKYFGHYKKVKLENGEIIYEKINKKEESEKRKETLEKRRKYVEEMKKKIQNYLDSGCTFECIANELHIPESTIRNMMKK